MIGPQPFFQWRGSPIRNSFNLLALSESGYEIDFLTLPVGEDADIAGVRIIRVPNLLRVKDVPIGPSAVKAIFNVFLFAKAIGLFRRHRYDFVHGVEEAGFLAVVLSKLFGSKAVYEKHSDPFSYRSGIFKNIVLSIYAKFEAFTIKQADLIICTGQGLVEQAEALAPTCPVYNIFDIPSSLVEANTTRTRAVAARLRRNPDDILITFVGSFAVYQGVDIMFDMIPYVARRDPRARFVIIGGSPDEVESNKARLGAESAHAVVFLSKIPPDEVPDYLAASDILIAPRAAGVNTPLKILDYFKAGGAIVATDILSNRLILDETTALFSRPDSNSFGDRVLQMLNDPELRARLGKNGYEKYCRKYNFREFKKRLAKAYRESSDV